KFPNVNDFYKVLDVAVKLGSGTGSVGLNRYYILIKGRREEYGNIILEMKEQTRSILQSFFSYYVPDDQAAKRYRWILYIPDYLLLEPWIVKQLRSHMLIFFMVGQGLTKVPM